MPTTAAQPTLLDDLTLEAVHLAFPESAREAGRSSVERGRVSRPSVRPVRADAVVVGADRRSHRTRLALANGGLTSSCSPDVPSVGVATGREPKRMGHDRVGQPSTQLHETRATLHEWG